VPQNRVDDFMVGDERDDLHLRTSRRAHQLVQLVDTLDEPGLTPAKGAGIRQATLFVARPCGANPAAPYKGGEQQHAVQYPGTAQGGGGSKSLVISNSNRFSQVIFLCGQIGRHFIGHPNFVGPMGVKRESTFGQCGWPLNAEGAASGLCQPRDAGETASTYSAGGTAPVRHIVRYGLL
jgi:hypothetical protein